MPFICSEFSEELLRTFAIQLTIRSSEPIIISQEDQFWLTYCSEATSATGMPFRKERYDHEQLINERSRQFDDYLKEKGYQYPLQWMLAIHSLKDPQQYGLVKQYGITFKKEYGEKYGSCSGGNLPSTRDISYLNRLVDYISWISEPTDIINETV